MSTETLVRQVLKESIRVKEALDPAAIAHAAELMRATAVARPMHSTSPPSSSAGSSSSAGRSPRSP
jgi:hypothetical protein